MFKNPVSTNPQLPYAARLNQQAETETVEFKIKPIDSKPWDDGVEHSWLGSYNSENKKVDFLIKLLIKTPSEENEYPFSVGTIITYENENNLLFLTKIAEKFKITDSSFTRDKQHIIDFRTAILGTNLYKGVGNNLLAGKFTDDEKGDWLVVKAFIGDKDSEFYLAINTVEGLGELYPKDYEYNEEVIKELSKVF